jgi:hypothetical protein
MDENQSKKDEVDELNKLIQAKEDMIRRVEDNFQEQMTLLDSTKKELHGRTVGQRRILSGSCQPDFIRRS